MRRKARLSKAERALIKKELEAVEHRQEVARGGAPLRRRFESHINDLKKLLKSGLPSMR